MATISAFSTPLHLISNTHFNTPKNLSFYPNYIHFQTKVCSFSSNNLTLSFKKGKTFYESWKVKSAEEEATAVAEPQEQEETTVAEQQESVSVPVSPSDTLRMYFQADGMLNEAEIPKVSKALEGAKGVSDLKVQVLEGIGTVELTKQTTVQVTGVASNLVELIQGPGFKLQTLNLSFDDEDDIIVWISYLDFEKLQWRSCILEVLISFLLIQLFKNDREKLFKIICKHLLYHLSASTDVCGFCCAP